MTDYLPFFSTYNQTAAQLEQKRPWEFLREPEILNKIRRLSKEKRGLWAVAPNTAWCMYTPVGGLAPNCRVSKDNPAAVLRGLAIDYDMQQSVQVVKGFVEQMPEQFRPNFIEVSLSLKIRLVWVFERELLVAGNQFCEAVITTIAQKLKAEHLLAGFDVASYRPTQIWTNGAEWHAYRKEPLSHRLVLGFAVDAGHKYVTGPADVPLDIVAAEVRNRFGNRWQGEFALNASGVRFWDPSADCPTGCQVKRDGMLCFTGRQPFVKWAEIFGSDWVNENRALHLAEAAGETYFDNKHYWRNVGGIWRRCSREDMLLQLKNYGISGRAGKGQTVSDAERVLFHIQRANAIDGAGSVVNRRPGLFNYDGKRMLNTYSGKALEPVAKENVIPDEDFPWLWHFINGLFDHPEEAPLPHFLAWLQRFYHSQLNYRSDMGQAIFLCGPPNNGKTLLSEGIVKPLVGNRSANPFEYFTGATPFNDNLLEAPLLSINDEEAPATSVAKRKFQAKIKSFVVNPAQTFHKKFCDKIAVPWTGRLLVTLNDDAESVGILPEKNSNTEDKLMFFGSRPYERQWPERLDEILQRELPFFARWLLDYNPPAGVRCKGRIGVNSFFDSRILRMSEQQLPAYNLLELLRSWCELGDYWAVGLPDEESEWKGTPTQLLSQLKGCEELAYVSSEWKAAKLAQSLTALSRIGELGITSLDDKDRNYRIVRAAVIKSPPSESAEAA